MLCLYLLGQNCLHLTFKPYLSSETHPRKYEKLPNINSCMWTYWRKNDIVKMSGPQILLSNCLFTFRPIASEQLNSLTTIDTLSWLGGAVVTHPLWVQDVPSRVQFQAPARVLFDVLFYCCCDFFLFVTHHYISENFAIPFAMLIYLVYLTYCKICDRL